MFFCDERINYSLLFMIALVSPALMAGKSSAIAQAL
jgi:hypothetical protein